MSQARPSVLFYARLVKPFAPTDLKTRPLGGSETALIHVARGLARHGHRVTVVAYPGEQAGFHDGVEYLDLRSTGWRERVAPDITVIFRQLPHAFRRLPGRVRLLWAHDHISIYPELPPGWRRCLLTAGWRAGHRVFGRRVPWIVPVSAWLGNCFIEYAGWPAGAVHPIPNGVDGTVYRALQPSQHRSGPPFRLVYTSVPQRGLELLLTRILPAVWRSLPEVELHVFTYKDKRLAAFRQLVAPGERRVHFWGGLPQQRLAAALAGFDLWVYPTDFPETSCIAAMEAQAAGLPVVASQRYGLQETVVNGRTGVLIPGTVGSPAYVEAFARTVVHLLENPERRAALGRQGRARILAGFTWERVALLWSELLERLARPGAHTLAG